MGMELTHFVSLSDESQRFPLVQHAACSFIIDRNQAYMLIIDSHCMWTTKRFQYRWFWLCFSHSRLETWMTARDSLTWSRSWRRGRKSETRPIIKQKWLWRINCVIFYWSQRKHSTRGLLIANKRKFLSQWARQHSHFFSAYIALSSTQQRRNLLLLSIAHKKSQQLLHQKTSSKENYSHKTVDGMRRKRVNKP